MSNDNPANLHATRAANTVVGLFYFFIVFFGVLLLATAQLRASSGSTFDTWRLNFDANSLSKFNHEQKLTELRKIAFDDRASLSYADQCLRLYDAMGGLKSGVDLDTQVEVKAARAAKKKYVDLEGDVGCVFRGFTMLQYDKDYYIGKGKETAQEISNVQELLKLDTEQYSDLAKGRQEFLAFKEMEHEWYTKLLVDTPYDLVVLLLVMLMGALGGIVRILRDYGDPTRTDPSLRDYYLIPLIGAVIAIGGYVLAKTGLLLLSSTKGETSLSPFMIGLVGMVSGLLAKEVIDRIAEYGHKVLKG
jgi:hypothetical protein